MNGRTTRPHFCTSLQTYFSVEDVRRSSESGSRIVDVLLVSRWDVNLRVMKITRRITFLVGTL